MKRLTYKQVLQIHSDLILATGGADGLRDMGMLESALNSPFQTFDEIDIYPTVQFQTFFQNKQCISSFS